MKWNKLLGLLIVSVLLIGGLAALASEPAKGQTQPETVTFGVSVDRSDALLQLAEGDADMFLQSVEATIYDGMAPSVKRQIGYWESQGGYNNYYFNRAWEGNGTSAMDNAVSQGWITEENSDGPLYEVHSHDDQWEFNPFAVQDVRYAMNHLVDRQAYIENLQDGYGTVRYCWQAKGPGVYATQFKPFIEGGDPDPTNGDFGMTPDGDQDWAETYIEDALTAIADATDDTTNNFQWNGKNITYMGNLRTPSNGDSGFWEYNPPDADEWRPVEITGAIREEDWRLEQGQDFADQLRNSVNIQVDEYIASRATLSPLIFSADPEPYDNVRWHFYTGGWLASGQVYYPDAALRQLHAPAYGYTLPAVQEGHWAYSDTEEGQLINELTYDPFAGLVETESEYWGQIRTALKEIVKDSVRVYTVTETNFFTYDDAVVNRAVPNAATGWDQVFGPRTLDTEDNEIQANYYSAEGALYMDNWNWYGGSEGAYGANQRRWVLGQEAWTHPQTGLAIEMVSEWNTTTDYNYNETGVLQSNLSIPETAMEYNVNTGMWQNVTNYYDKVPNVASKAKITRPDGNWHDGSEMGLKAIAEYYGRVKNIVYENDGDNDDYYYSTYASEVKPWWTAVKAIEFHPDENAYTMYGNYTFPVETEIGSYYVINPRTAQHVYEAIHQEVSETDWSVHTDTSFGWDSGEGDVYVHLMGTGQINDYYIPTMQSMIDNGYVAQPVKESQPLDDNLTYSASEYGNKLQNAIDFANNNNNLFISYGPYYINDNIPEINEIELKRWSGYTDYNTWEYWQNQFDIRTLELANIQAPEERYIGEDDLTVSCTGWIAQLFPTQGTESISSADPAVATLENETGVVKATTDLTLNEGTDDTGFEGTFSASDLEGLAEGNYELSITVGAEGLTRSIERSVLLLSPTYFDVTIDNYDETVTEGDTVTVEYTVENPRVLQGIQDITVSVNGTTEATEEDVTLAQDETFTGTFEWTTEEGDAGDYDIVVASDDDSDSVTVTVEAAGDGGGDDGGGGIPGFTLLLLAVAAVVAIAIYHKKPR